jgi:hypothetical protein
MPPTHTRRKHVLPDGRTVTVLTAQGEAGPIDTVRDAPRCRCCGKALRPNYNADKRSERVEHLFTQQPDNRHATWDAARGRWVVVARASRLTRRVFTGSFGAYADNLFCGLRCGYTYGKAAARREK